MKLCMLCGEVADDSAATCPRDGEASWAMDAQSRAGATPADVLAESDATPADVQTKPKRGRR